MQNPKQMILAGLLVAGLGSIPLLAALNIIPADDSEFGAPRWLVAILASSFPAVGLYLILQSLSSLTKNAEVRNVFTQLVFLFLILTLACFLGGSGVFLTMMLFSPSTDTSALAIGPISISVPASAAGWFGRLPVAIAALFVDVLAVVVAWSVVKRILQGMKNPEE